MRDEARMANSPGIRRDAPYGMCRLMVVLHNGLADWSCELRQPVGDLPDQRSRVRE